MKKPLIFLIIVIGVLVLFYLLKNNSGNNQINQIENVESDFNSKYEQISEVINSSTKCQVIAESFVKQSLKNPRSADFYGGTVHEPLSSNTVKLIGKFSATNTYGGTIENLYRIKLKFNGGEWTEEANWEVISLEFE